MNENKKRILALGLVALTLAVLLMSAAAATGTGDATGPGGACILTPQFEIADANVSARAGEVGHLRVVIGGRQAAECGPMQFGVDFTNAYDASKFYLGVQGAKDKRNLVTLAPGELKMFDLYAGVVPGTAAGSYKLQVTAYSEADHWKQTSKPVSLTVLPAKADETYWATPLSVGWNTIPYAEGVSVFGCPAITEGYAYSPSLGDFVRMVREGATFSPMGTDAMPAGEKNGGLFVFSKKRCVMQSLVPPEIFQRAPVAQEKEQLLTVSPDWTDLNATQLAKKYCPQIPDALVRGYNPMPISVWNAVEQRWEKLGANLIQNGQVLRLHERTFACALGG
ncbi:MAG: hypothetical protein V1728_05465 [Candidatus Micrarchaeota archaeon]